jgi:hypothetical protein
MSGEDGSTNVGKRWVPCDRCGGNVTNYTVLASATETDPAEVGKSARALLLGTAQRRTSLAASATPKSGSRT